MGKYQTRVEKDIAFIFMFCGGSVGYFLFRLTITIKKMRFCKGFNLAISLGMDAVIPPKANRKKQLFFDRYLYRYRHLVENRFLDFKRWRGIATRYAKKLASFAAAIEIRIIAMWLKIL